jgi:hypothetical protein
MIRNYNDFVTTLLEAGFSLGGGNNEGIYSIISWDWNQPPPYDTPVRWHTGDKETDPWEWRMRVLEERRDIAYAKLFFKKSGYITKEWYPYFLAVRRGGRSFDQAYGNGANSHEAKRIYDAIREHGTLPLHAIKENAGFAREDKSAFDRALVELQMKLYITMCGRQQKTSQKGEEYGWSSTVFTLTEEFFGEGGFQAAAIISEQEAVEKITTQVLRLNPQAEQKKILKFIRG